MKSQCSYSSQDCCYDHHHYAAADAAISAVVDAAAAVVVAVAVVAIALEDGDAAVAEDVNDVAGWQVLEAVGYNVLYVVAVIAATVAAAAVVVDVIVVLAGAVELVTIVLVAVAAVAAAVDYEQNVVAVVLYDGLLTSMSVGPSAIERRRTSVIEYKEIK